MVWLRINPANAIFTSILVNGFFHLCIFFNFFNLSVVYEHRTKLEAALIKEKKYHRATKQGDFSLQFLSIAEMSKWYQLFKFERLFKISKHNLGTRNRNILLQILNVNYEIGKNGFFFVDAKLCN